MPLTPTEQAAVDRMAATKPADFDGNGYELAFPNRLNDAAIGIGAAGREIETTSASAVAAKESQDAAKASENAAAGSATAAGTARAGAEAARDASISARQGSEAARDTAQGHRTAAGNSATAAGNSAVAAKGSEDAAAASAAAAGTAKSGAEAARDAAVTARSGAEGARGEAQTAAAQSQEGAARLVGTSTTSLAIGTGDKVFTTQAGKAYGVGSRVVVTNDAQPALRIMYGLVTAYNGTSLTVAVDIVVGAGTYAAWTIRLDGLPGPVGQTGTTALLYEARTANAQIVKADQGKLIDITAGTFTQTFATPASLGAGFVVEVRNSGSGEVTIPSSDGATNWIMYEREHRAFFSDGINLRSVILRPFEKFATVGFTCRAAPGYAAVEVFGIGAQGGGGGGSFSTNGSLYQGGGAPSGIPFEFPRIAVSAGDYVPIVLGAGGSPGTNGTEASPSGTAGTQGGSTFVGIGAINGGQPGAGATPTAAGTSPGRVAGEFGPNGNVQFASQSGEPAGGVSFTWRAWSKELLIGSGKGGGGSKSDTTGAAPTGGHNARAIIRGVV